MIFRYCFWGGEGGGGVVGVVFFVSAEHWRDSRPFKHFFPTTHTNMFHIFFILLTVSM